MIDLNELHDDTNCEAPVRDVVGAQVPAYCTQPGASQTIGGCNEVVVESPNPTTVQRVAAQPEAIHADSDTFNDTTIVGETGGTIAQDGFGIDNDDEAWSQPKEPTIGMRFNTLEGAQEHYNAYAMRLGFSIKMNTSRKSTLTGQLEKQQFVCNKFRKAKVDDGGAEVAPTLDEIPDICEHADDDDAYDDIVFIDDQCAKKKKRKKRKRDTIVHIGCRARMVVKLKDGWWEVIFFIAEHNHALVDKPSLTKYLAIAPRDPSRREAIPNKSS
ncbi:hypothetical protein VPH35_008449 [Triticum aestivum]|uniref:protein FAR1-RELATED SEQUENCE 5 n=1 Tax=Triticum aestivum TaxID=4565 RepID=UPI000843D4EB|nr:protein FAR1-RELATED SEQUENCE 5-like [Triticum aestivum]